MKSTFTDQQARFEAFGWIDNGDPVHVFASTGRIETRAEIAARSTDPRTAEECMMDSLAESLRGGWLDKKETLDAFELIIYLREHGPRDAVEGWGNA